MRQIRAWLVLYASVAYCVVGVATAALAASASAAGVVKGWRLATWLLSLATFCAHFIAERRRGRRVLVVARRVALAVGLGAFALAALGPVRSHWGEPSRVKLVALSLVAWPILTGLPAFFVAFVGGRVLEHTRNRAHALEPEHPLR